MISVRGAGGGVCQADVYQWNISSHLPGLASLRWCCLMKNARQIGQSPARPLHGPPSPHPDSAGIIKSGGNYLRRKRYALLSRQQVMVRRSLPRPIDCLTSQWVGGISGGGRGGRLLAIIVDNTRFMNMLRAILRLAGRVIRAFLEHLKRGRIIT